MTVRLFAALASLFLILALAGFIKRKRSRGLEDFFLASRNLSSGIMALSLSASWFGASSVLVSMDEACRTGLGAVWIIGVPAILTILLLASAFVRPIHELPFLSLPDLVEVRYGRAVRHMAAALLVWYMVMLAASQMVAAGLILRSFLGTSYFLSLCAAAAVVFLYATAGGLMSVARAGSVQFLLLVAGLGALFLSLRTRGSFDAAGASAASAGIEGFFDPFRGFGRQGLIALSFTLAWTVSPIAWQRIQSVRRVKDARRGLLLSAGSLAALYAAVIASGMLFLPVFGLPKEGLPLLSVYIAEGAGPWLGSLLFVAVLSAVISTMDAAVNTGALSVTRDILQQIYPRLSDRSSVLAGRLATILVGCAAVAVASRFRDILKTIGLASQILAQGLFIPGMAMLFLKRKVPLAGALSLLLGGGFSLASFISDAGILRLNLPPWPYSLPFGFGLGAAGFVAGLALSNSRNRP